MDIKPANIFISREQKINLQGEESADDGFEEEHVEEEEEVTYKIGQLYFIYFNLLLCYLFFIHLFFMYYIPSSFILLLLPTVLM